MALDPSPRSGPYQARQQPGGQRMEVQRGGGPANLADILERVLDKGIVIAGDIQINLLDIELLTIKLRLLVASVERAQEMGINWWESDPSLSSHAKELEEENEDLKARLERLEDRIGLAPAEPGEEVVVETRTREVVEEDAGASKDELLRQAQSLDIPGRSSMSKEELARAVEEIEGDEEGR
jgi:gas vesicle protein GvpA/GvpJ/GvpM family